MTSDSSPPDGTKLTLEVASDLGGPIKKLLVAWGCGLTWGWGIFLTFTVYIAWALSGVPFGEPDPLTALQGFVLGLGLILTLASPVFMGAFLARSWRRGLSSGLVALLMVVIGLPAFYWVLELLSTIRLLSDVLMDYSFSIIVGIPVAVAVTTVFLMSTRAFLRRYWGASLGLAIGLGLSIVSGLVLSRSMSILTGDVIDLSITLTWQIPPLVWVSAVYFLELMAGRSGWKGFIVWALLILAAFGLPFIVIPVLEPVFVVR